MPIYPDTKSHGKLTGRYRVEVQLNGHRKRGRFDTLPEAQRVEQQWKDALATGENVGCTTVRPEHVSPMTLRQLLDKAAPMLWGDSAHGRMSHVKVEWIVRHLGDPRLTDLGGDYVDWAVTALRASGKSPATVNRYLSALRSVLDWGQKRKHLDSVPEFDWQPEAEGRLRYLSREEEQSMIAELLSLGFPVVADFVVAAIDTGCRRSELLHATRDQLDGIWLRLWKTKNGHARSVPLSLRAKCILESNLPWQLTEAQLRYAWDKAKQSLNLGDDFVVHALRHTCATRLVEHGVNLRVVQQFMGHRSIQTTIRYAHVSDATLAAAAAVIDKE